MALGARPATHGVSGLEEEVTLKVRLHEGTQQHTSLAVIDHRTPRPVEARVRAPASETRASFSRALLPRAGADAARFKSYLNDFSRVAKTSSWCTLFLYNEGLHFSPDDLAPTVAEHLGALRARGLPTVAIATLGRGRTECGPLAESLSHARLPVAAIACGCEAFRALSSIRPVVHRRRKPSARASTFRSATASLSISRRPRRCARTARASRTAARSGAAQAACCEATTSTVMRRTRALRSMSLDARRRRRSVHLDRRTMAAGGGWTRGGARRARTQHDAAVRRAAAARPHPTTRATPCCGAAASHGVPVLRWHAFSLAWGATIRAQRSAGGANGPADCTHLGCHQPEVLSPVWDQLASALAEPDEARWPRRWGAEQLAGMP